MGPFPGLEDFSMAVVVDTSAVIAVAGNEPIKPRLIEVTRGEG